MFSHKEDESHAAAMDYIYTCMSPHALASHIPDSDATPCIKRNLDLRETPDAPTAPFCIYPKVHSRNPRVDIYVKALSGSLEGRFIKHLSVFPSEVLSQSYTRHRVVSSAVKITTGIHEAAVTDITGRFIGGVTTGSVDLGNLSQGSLRNNTVDHRVSEVDADEGIVLVSRPIMTPFLNTSPYGKRSGIENNELVSVASPDTTVREYRVKYSTIKPGLAGFNDDNLADDNQQYFSTGSLFPKALSSSVRVNLLGSLEVSGVPTGTTAKIKLDIVTATINSSGAATLIETNVATSEHKRVDLNNVLNFNLSFDNNENDGVEFPEGQIVAIKVKVGGQIGPSDVDIVDAELRVVDLDPLEVEHPTPIAIGSGFPSNFPLHIDGVLNIEAVPDDDLARHVKMKSQMVGAQFREKALESLLGSPPLYRGVMKEVEYDALTSSLVRNGTATAQARNAYALSWGSIWNFVKPGFRALVPGASDAISSVLGERFNQPLRDLGKAAFAKGRSALASSRGPSNDSTPAINLHEECSNELQVKVRCKSCPAPQCTVSKRTAHAATNEEFEAGFQSLMDEYNASEALLEGIKPDAAEEIEFLDEVGDRPDELSGGVEAPNASTTESFFTAAGKSHIDSDESEYGQSLSRIGSMVSFPVIDVGPAGRKAEQAQIKIRVGAPPRGSELEAGSESFQFAAMVGANVHIDRRLVSDDFPLFVEQVLGSDLAHSKYRKAADLSITVNLDPKFDNISGKSHYLATLLALMGYQPTTMFSGEVRFENSRPLLVPISGAREKAEFALNNNFKLVLSTDIYRPSASKRTCNQADIDKGNRKDGRSPYDSTAVYMVTDLSTALQLARDARNITNPEVVKGEKPSASLIKDDAPLPQAAVVRIPERMAELVGMDEYTIAKPSDLTAMTGDLKEKFPNVFKSFNPSFGNTIGLMPLNDKGERAQVGEKVKASRYEVKESFNNSLANLERVLDEHVRKRDQGAKKKKKGGGVTERNNQFLSMDDFE